MCWSASVSLNTFVFSLFGTCFALANGAITIPHALFFLSVASIQLVEYFAWTNMKNTSVPSKVGLLLILIQIPLMINAYYTGPHKELLCGLYLVLATLCLTSTKLDFTMEKAPNGHLAWNWLIPSFTLLYLVFAIGTSFYFSRIVHTLLYLSMALLSLYFYLSEGTFASMWCWISNISSLWIIFKVFRQELC